MIRFFPSVLIFLFGCSNVIQVPIPTIEPTIPPNVAPTIIVINITTPIATQLNESILPNNWDGGILSESPCTAPCFAGIIPGETSEEEAINIIRQDPTHFQNCQIIDLSNQYSYRDSDKSLRCYGLGMNISRDTGLIEAIGFGFVQKITLSQLIEKYGEPTSVDVSPDGIPEAPKTYMIVFFDKNKIGVDFGSQVGSSFHLNVTVASNIASVIYYSGVNANMDSFTQPWNGYGEYQCIGC